MQPIGSIHGRFEELAQAAPDHPAIDAGSWLVSYGGLNRAANRWARRFVAAGLRPGDRAALLMRHDGPLIGAALAVLKAGGVVVVVNPGEPPARIEQVLSDAEPTLLVGDSTYMELARSLALNGRTAVEFTPEEPAPNAVDSANLDLPISGDDLAILVYTSGTTGRPKGVMRLHKCAVHDVRRFTHENPMDVDDRVALLGSLSGGQGTATTWSTLLSGAVLLPFPAVEKGVVGLAEFLRERRVSVYISSGSLLRHFLKTLSDDDRFPDMRLLRMSSEPADEADFAAIRSRFPAECLLMHCLSSSETGKITTQYFSSGDPLPQGRIPLGKPALDMQVDLLDEHGAVVGRGERGEIVVRSKYIAQGYWRNPELTAQKFTPTDAEGYRTYRSGDLAWWNEDGLLMHAGRKDARVKIRGYRIEIAEVEEALQRLPQVDKAVACAVPKCEGGLELELAAFVVLKAGGKAAASELRRALRASLPSHMVPSRVRFLDALPLSPNGKVDRQRLRNLPTADELRAAGEPPKTEAERLLAGIWGDLFQDGAVGRDADFFDLGGDSLVAAVAAARIHAAWNVELELSAFAEHPRLADLAVVVEARRGEGSSTPPLTKSPRGVDAPLSFVQERTWNALHSSGRTAMYVVAKEQLLRGPLKVDLLLESLHEAGLRHDTLRTTFHEVDGRAVQRVHDACRLPVEIVDASHSADPEAEAAAVLRRIRSEPTALDRLPLVRFALVKLRRDEHVLIRTAHHIISDQWSWDMFFHDAARIYEAKRNGDPFPPASNDALQYADYAVWQRRTFAVDSPHVKKTLDWWAEYLHKAPRRLKLPFARRWRKSSAQVEEGCQFWGPSQELVEALDQAGMQLGATYFVLRLAGFAAVLAASTGQRDLVLGAYVTNRNRLELQTMFGFFANLTNLRIQVDPGLSFRALTAQVRKIVGQVQARADVPYEMVVDELRRRGRPAPKIQAIFHATDSRPVRFGQADMTSIVRKSRGMPWGYTATFSRTDESNQCRSTFDARLYDPVQIRAFIADLLSFLGRAVESPDLPLHALLPFAPTRRLWLPFWRRAA